MPVNGSSSVNSLCIADEVPSREFADAEIDAFLPSREQHGLCPKSPASPGYSRPCSVWCALLPELFAARPRTAVAALIVIQGMDATRHHLDHALDHSFAAHD